MKLLASCFVILFVVGALPADTIVNQPYDGTSPGRWAQEFSDWSELSIWEFDDIHTVQDWAVETFTVYGIDFGPPDLVEEINGEIWDALPGSFGGNVVIASVDGTYNGDGTLTISFGGQQLPAGDYWITGWITRVSAGFNADYFWLATTPVTDSEHYVWNPGGMFWDPDPLPGSQGYGGDPLDLAFTLEGTPTAECAGDLDGDGTTGQSDLGILLADWGCIGDCVGDLDGDGHTGQSDLGILLADWGCPG